MALQFQAPDWLIKEYMDRPTPGQGAMDAVNKAAATYVGYRGQQDKSRQDKINGAITAFKSGGPGMLQVYAKTAGMDPKDLSAISSAFPGLTPETSGSVAGTPPPLMQPPPSSASSPFGPQIPPQQDDLLSAMDQVHGPMPAGPSVGSPIIDHWNNSQGAARPTVQAPGPTPPTATSARPAWLPAGVKDAKDLVGMGEFGESALRSGDAYEAHQQRMKEAGTKEMENAPRSANQLRQDFVLAGKGDMADDWIKAHAPESLNNPDSPAINIAQVNEANKWLATGAQNSRGSYFDTMGNVQTQKLREGLIKEARTTLDPYFQTGEGRSQAQRLNSIGRTEPLIVQMLDQKNAGDSRQMRELATRVDAILKGSPGGQQAVEGINGLVPQTARGKFANWLEWFSNDPVGNDQKAFIVRYADTIGREKAGIQNQVRQTIDRTAPTLRVLKSQFPDDYNAVVNPYVSGQHAELTGEILQTISDDESFRALPPGTKFKSPDGQTHTKK